jgi:hypothetical protein
MPHFKDSENKIYWLDEGDDPAVWLPQCTPITEAEKDSILAAQQAAAEAMLTYTQKRVGEYPPIGDQLDALFKAGVFPADMAARIQAVKDKYPKA